MSLEKVLKDKQTVAVLCNQWGDSGKGKIVDLLTETWADYVLRGTGGNNAGHTVVIGNNKYIFHLLPSGILHDGRGVVNVLGNGMVINLGVLVQEMDTLNQEGHTYKNLRISGDAHVILPWHVLRDKSANQSQVKGGIGSTGRGIGPCYEDKIGRRGIAVWDILNPDVLAKKLTALQARYADIPVGVDVVIDELQKAREQIEPFVRDTVTEVQQALKNDKRLLLEGAQGLLLSSEHGTYPFVTGSDCSLNGTASGVGLCAKNINLSLGLMKFPFMTRVGAGPFSTEFGGQQSEVHCGDETVTREAELLRWKIPFTKEGNKIQYNPQDPQIRAMMNDTDPFVQGIGIRLAADEYGATTGRPRRTGWTDLVSARYAATINGSTLLVLTKSDALAGIDSFKLCTGYRLGGKDMSFRKDSTTLRAVEPQYETFEGYGSLEGITAFERLHGSLQRAIIYVEEMTGVPVGLVGTGAERDRVIVTT